MTLDIRNESPISLAAAARLLPPSRRGRPVNISTIFRWIIDGVKLPNGSVVRLEASRLGGRSLTSVEALERFADRQTPKVGESVKVEPPRTPGKRQRASDRAADALTKAGI